MQYIGISEWSATLFDLFVVSDIRHRQQDTIETYLDITAEEIGQLMGGN